MKYRLMTYDVWGNSTLGFEVNNIFGTSILIDVDDSTSDRAINRRLGIRGVEWEGDHQTLYGTQKSNGKPICELRTEA